MDSAATDSDTMDSTSESDGAIDDGARADGGRDTDATPSSCACDPIANTGCSDGMHCVHWDSTSCRCVENGPGSTGDSCSSSEDCSSGYFCDQTVSVCLRYCGASSMGACPDESGYHLATCLSTTAAGDALPDGVGACTLPCFPQYEGCGTGGACEIGKEGSFPYSYCRVAGARGNGQSCSELEPCAATLTCVDKVCHEYCDSANPSTGCTGGQTCVANLNAGPLGVCM